MKIALCLYGYLRQFEMVYPNIIKNLNLEDKDFDLFIHTSQDNHIKKVRPSPVKWIPLNKLNKEFFEKKYENLKSIKFNQDDNEYFDLTKKIFEDKQKKIKEFINKNNDIIIQNKKLPCIKRLLRYSNMNFNKNIFNKHFQGQPWIFRQNDQFVRLHLCNELMNKYAKEKDIKYDLVITLRPDIFITKEFDLFKNKNEFEEGKLLFKRGVDFFYAGNHETINKLADLIINVYKDLKKEYLLNKVYLSPEAQTHMLISNNMKLIKIRNIRAAYLHKNPLKNYFYENFDKKCEELYKLKLFNISQPLLRIT